jgi:hypothetical protein
MLDTNLILTLEFGANTTYTLDIHIYTGKIDDRKYQILRNRADKRNRSLFFCSIRKRRQKVSHTPQTRQPTDDVIDRLRALVVHTRLLKQWQHYEKTSLRLNLIALFGTIIILLETPYFSPAFPSCVQHDLVTYIIHG